MANLARFRINQTAYGMFGYARRDILPTSEAGEVQFEAENAGLGYLWEIIQPPGSNVTIGSSTSQTAIFAAEQDGGYVVKLTVNPGSADEDVDSLYFGIGTMINGQRFCLPSVNETIQDNSLGHPEWGWWEKLYGFFRELASYAGVGGGDSFFEVGTGDNSLQRKDYGNAQGPSSWALGMSSLTTGFRAWSIGSNSLAAGDESIAFGDRSYAEGDYSFCFGTEVHTLDGSTCFGYGYENAMPFSLAIGHSDATTGISGNPQTMRIAVNGITDPTGVPSRLFVDPARYHEIGPVPAFSYLNIQFHVVAKSDDGTGLTPALVTFDGEVQALSSDVGITYQDWTINKNILAGTPVYSEDIWDLSIPATSSSLDKLEFIIVQDDTEITPAVVWSGYIDIAYVATVHGGGGAPS